MITRVLAVPVIVSEGRITFHTAYIETGVNNCVLSLVPGEPVIIYLDPSKEPQFSKHPQGGWVSPVWDRLAEAEAAETEIDYIHIHCRCHKRETLTGDDLYSLEQTGHTADCRHGMPVSGSPINKLFPSAANVLTQARNTPLPPSSPSSAKPTTDAQNPMNAIAKWLNGTCGSIQDACKELGLAVETDSTRDILKSEYHFMPCTGCATWGFFQNSTNPMCRACAAEVESA